VTVRAPEHAPAWLKLAELLRLADRDKEADDAEASAIGKQAAWPPAADLRLPAEIDKDEGSLREEMLTLADPAEQEIALRERLRHDQTNTAAMRLLGRIEWSRDNLAVARTLFEHALSLAPAYEGLRADYAQLLRKLGEPGRAVVETGFLVSRAPANAFYRALHADALRAIGDFDGALSIMEQLVRERPTQGRFRFGYAQALHFAGRREESVKEFRACLDMNPGMGEAYWGLAELRGNYLTDKDVADITMHLRDGKQEEPRIMLLQYALGHALEKRGRFAECFSAYAGGAALARKLATEKGEAYDPIEDAGKQQDAAR
jgi:tetratricopeptide (TPR) repeat protein